ncbi:MAG: hypothetical protein FWH03_05995 [Firmicutes bacterium]|nr:hypothetical protein [Bacillota bacterium]
MDLEEKALRPRINCPSCGWPNGITLKICSDCGASLLQEPTPPEEVLQEPTPAKEAVQEEKNTQKTFWIVCICLSAMLVVLEIWPLFGITNHYHPLSFVFLFITVLMLCTSVFMLIFSKFRSKKTAKTALSFKTFSIVCVCTALFFILKSYDIPYFMLQLSWLRELRENGEIYINGFIYINDEINRIFLILLSSISMLVAAIAGLVWVVIIKFVGKTVSPKAIFIFAVCVAMGFILLVIGEMWMWVWVIVYVGPVAFINFIVYLALLLKTTAAKRKLPNGKFIGTKGTKEYGGAAVVLSEIFAWLNVAVIVVYIILMIIFVGGSNNEIDSFGAALYLTSWLVAFILITTAVSAVVKSKMRKGGGWPGSKASFWVIMIIGIIGYSIFNSLTKQNQSFNQPKQTQANEGQTVIKDQFGKKTELQKDGAGYHKAHTNYGGGDSQEKYAKDKTPGSDKFIKLESDEYVDNFGNIRKYDK